MMIKTDRNRGEMSELNLMGYCKEDMEKFYHSREDLQVSNKWRLKISRKLVNLV